MFGASRWLEPQAGVVRAAIGSVAAIAAATVQSLRNFMVSPFEKNGNDVGNTLRSQAGCMVFAFGDNIFHACIQGRAFCVR
jgi:hypothetical protein